MSELSDEKGGEAGSQPHPSGSCSCLHSPSRGGGGPPAGAFPGEQVEWGEELGGGRVVERRDSPCPVKMDVTFASLVL